MVGDSAKHEILYRWWTDRYTLPVEVEVLEYKGAATWSIRFPNGAEPDVDENLLYEEELYAIYDFLDDTDELAKAIDKLLNLAVERRQSLDATAREILAERAIANSKLDKGR